MHRERPHPLGHRRRAHYVHEQEEALLSARSVVTAAHDVAEAALSNDLRGVTQHDEEHGYERGNHNQQVPREADSGLRGELRRHLRARRENRDLRPEPTADDQTNDREICNGLAEHYDEERPREQAAPKGRARQKYLEGADHRHACGEVRHSAHRAEQRAREWRLDHGGTRREAEHQAKGRRETDGGAVFPPLASVDQGSSKSRALSLRDQSPGGQPIWS